MHGFRSTVFNISGARRHCFTEKQYFSRLLPYNVRNRRHKYRRICIYQTDNAIPSRTGRGLRRNEAISSDCFCRNTGYITLQLLFMYATCARQLVGATYFSRGQRRLKHRARHTICRRAPIWNWRSRSRNGHRTVCVRDRHSCVCADKMPLLPSRKIRPTFFGGDT